ncbi:MAG: CRISPR-associated helicase Cas3' [archaeon]
MNCLNFIIPLNKEEFDDIEKKLSHPNKILKEHIKEIILTGKKILKYYNFDKHYFEALEYLACTHDLGKLSKDWSVKNVKNPSHSDVSVKLILEKKFFFPFIESWQIVLLFFVFKHHSILKRESFEIPNIEYDINLLLKKKLNTLSWDEKINLVDTFGIFKIADFISSQSENRKDGEDLINKLLKPLKLSEEKIKNILVDIDENKWQKQQFLTKLKGTVILQAPTGWGKTTVSSLFAVDKSFKKIFYLLPTITAIRDFKIKLNKIFGEENVETYFYFYDVEKQLNNLYDFKEMFYARNFLKPVIITTIDQFLLTFLQVDKYFLKRFNFRDSLIILDEIHLLSPIMLNLFINFFKKFQKHYQMQLLIMSATLPKGMRDYLKEKLKIKKTNCLNFIKELKKKKRIEFIYNKHDIEESLEDVIRMYKQNKKVLVIINTVEKAIRIGRRLKEEFGIKDIIVFHSRFIYKHRFKKEKEILKDKRKLPHILVSTQISEVSLDISYDYLFTELAPFGSLIQRFGRVNRYGSFVNEVNAQIFYPKEVEEKQNYVYEKEELKISEEIIESLKRKGIKNEIEIYKKIDEILTKEKLEQMIEKFSEKISIEAWEEILSYFYSFSIEEENLRKILEYKENFTTLVLLSPNMIEDESLKKEIEDLLNLENKMFKSFEEKQKFFAKVKSYSLPVPYWIAKSSKTEKAFPILEIKNYSYNYNYGLYELEFKDCII